MDSDAREFFGGSSSYPNNDTLAFECGHSGVEEERASGLGRNPFVAATRHEMDENFPCFEQAMLLDQSGGSVLSCGNSVVLSISARAALNEHNRYVARYGMDDSFQAHGSPPQHVETESSAPLDLDWERLLLNTINVNLSGLSSLPSTHSASNNLETDIRITSNVDQLENTVLSHGVEGIEVVRSDLSVSDYFDTSRISELRTPERLHAMDMPGTGVTVRGALNHDDPFDNDGSRISDSSSNVSLKRMQQLFFSAGLPMPDTSSSPTSSPHTAENSLLLTNADLSRISADGSDFNVDVSVSYNPSLNSSVKRDLLIEDTGQSKSRHATEMDGRQHQRLRPPFMNVSPQSSPYRGPQLSPRRRPLSKPSPPMEPFQHKSFSPARHVKRHGASSSTSQQTHPQTPTRSSPNNSLCSMPYIQDPELAILELSPISKTRPRARSSQQGPTSVHHAKEEDDDSRLEMLGLSPISRQAADVAVQIINDQPDWKTKPIQKSGHQAVDTNSSGESVDVPPAKLVFGAILDDEHCSFEPSSSSEDNQGHPSVVAYKSNSLNDECRDDVSPLHSSSEQKKDSSNDTSNAASSDLKKSSLSSITPNSSSEHHVASLQEVPSARPSQSNSTQTMSDKQNSRTVSQATAASPPWSADDRRRYRTVVPIRVFITEPNDFPNEDDSFSAHFSRRLSPTLVGASQKLGPVRADYDSRSVPCIPVVSPEGQRQRIGERSFMSSPQ
jgi:hypothetical protein